MSVGCASEATKLFNVYPCGVRVASEPKQVDVSQRVWFN